MLVTKEELRFDFQGAAFDLATERDRKLLAWVFDQFLYGEVTGIQCGHWLYHAPHFGAATFLAKQAAEELGHVRRILRIFSILGEKPGPAHPAIRFLSTGMMGNSWGEHVALEMALGEGLVLGVFYAMVDTIREPEIHRILDTASSEEERHVEFGERETQAWLHAHPGSRKIILAQALIQAWTLRKLKGYVIRRLVKSAGCDHPVLGRFEAFYEHALRCFELRIERLGLSRRPLGELSLIEKIDLLALLPFRWVKARFSRGRRLLTSTYLDDPVLTSESERFRPG